MEVLVLGPIEARLAGANVDLGTPKQRALLCALALSIGRPVAVDSIVDLLWGEDAPPGVAGTLQSYVSGLRRVLEPQRERRRPADTLVTVAPGYALRLLPEATDAGQFAASVGTQHRLLAGVPLLGSAGVPRDALAEAVGVLDRALDLWRGRPYAELEGAPDAVAERARLDDLRLLALEDRAVASLALGHHATVAAELEALTASHPLRERLWGLRAVALARSGRQADALESLSTVRAVLAEELGLEPGIELRDLQTAVLRQDPELAWTEPAASPAAATAIPVQRTARSAPPMPTAPQTAPLVGRQAELATLEELLDAADGGTASYAALVGDPGIGKSRLAAELGHRARLRGWHTVVGRCSQDDGAPPFWPWMAALGALGSTVPTVEAEAGDEGARFRVWEEISAIVRTEAQDEPLLLVVEDLHWADSSSLGALRVLVEAMTDERLLVVTTRRAHPEPAGPLADLVETAARRHSVQVSLEGLGDEDAAKVAEQVIGSRPTRDESAALRARTDGNPFFIVEYARLAHRGGLGELLAEENPPAAVQDVLGRRISRLPDGTVDALRTAAVIGRRFDAKTLARAARIDEDDLLDVVEPAQAAGLVREDGIDRFVFAHALVVDTLLSGLRPSRRGRVHARVAEALTGTGQATELARHWLASGPAHAGQAWRAAVAGAEQSRSLHDHPRAAELLVAAIERLDLDPAATLGDRYDVLLALIDAHRWGARWIELIDCVEQAIAVAEQIGDVELIARAAISTAHGALWQSAPYGEVHEDVVAALRRSVAELPPGDSTLRARVLLALATEIYYVAPVAERRDLVEAALAMAGRLGDRQLELEAHETAFMALWVPGNVEQRLAHADAAVALAGELGNERAAVVTGCLRAVALNELGRTTEMFAEIDAVRTEAERLRLPYGLIVLDVMLVPWYAMSGRFDECAALLEEIQELDARTSNSGEAVLSAMFALQRWQGRHAEMVEPFLTMVDSPFEVEAGITATMWRAGQHDRAREFAATHPAPLEHDTWFSMMAWGYAAETARYLDDAELGRQAHDLLEPYAGQAMRAGSALAAGPVDVYLAMAASATGDTAAARKHADRAAELCSEWRLPVVARWLDELRETYAF